MTFGAIWRGDGESFSGSDRFTNKNYAAERGDTGGYPGSSPYSMAGGHGQTIWAGPGPSKSKKADKKQAAMSALTLIAFLFFLNILQNCLKEQKEDSTSATVMVLEAKLVQSREPEPDNLQDHVLQDKIDLVQNTETLKTRKLLSIVDDKPIAEPTRKRKFVHDFEVAAHDWTNELTQITNNDLQDQQRKLEKLREKGNHRRREKDENDANQVLPAQWHSSENENIMRTKVKKFVNNPVLSDLRTIPKLSQYWKAQKTTSTTAEPIKYIEFEEPVKKVADFHDFEPLSGSGIGTTLSLQELENSLLRDAAKNLQYQNLQQHSSKNDDLSIETTETLQTPASLVMRPLSPTGEVEAVSDPYGDTNALNTPRYRRRSEELSTEYPADLFMPEADQVTTTAASSTQRTFHVFTDPSQMHSGIWHTTRRQPTTSTTEPTSTQMFNIDNIYLTTIRPMPARIFSPQRPPPNHRPYYSSPTRYEYSPYRRVHYEPPLERHEYYPMSVVGQYGGNENGTGMGLLQLLWSLVSSFAKPIVSLVPNVSKVGGDSPCIELLTCEATRFGKYMGPTAQIMANTFSSVIRWAAPESERFALEDALAAAQENSCLKQIETCDYRSGGKSVLTIFAKMMEQKSNREPKGATHLELTT